MYIGSMMAKGRGRSRVVVEDIARCLAGACSADSSSGGNGGSGSELDSTGMSAVATAETYSQS